MENFHISAADFIPEVNFDANKYLLEISGQSFHEYTSEFYEPIFQWVEDFLKVSSKDITINFKMTYFNTASSKCLFDIVEMLKEYQESGSGKVTVNWYYQEEDDDMLETGEDFIEDSGMKINLVEYK